MVSGVTEDMLPQKFMWELREVVSFENDLNTDLHVDTYHQAIKVWYVDARRPMHSITAK